MRRYTIKLFQNGKVVHSLISKKKRRILYFFQADKFPEHANKVYIKVDYGDGFHNDGTYNDFKTLSNAWRAFNEE